MFGFNPAGDYNADKSRYHSGSSNVRIFICARHGLSTWFQMAIPMGDKRNSEFRLIALVLAYSSTHWSMTVEAILSRVGIKCAKALRSLKRSLESTGASDVFTSYLRIKSDG